MEHEKICPVCNGSGTIRHYDTNEEVTCFRCNGTGYIYLR